MRKRHQKLLKLSVFFFFTVLSFGLSVPYKVQAKNNIKHGDHILLGQADDTIGFSGEWIVLDAEHTNTGDEGMFLLVKDAIGLNTENGMLYRDIGDDIVVTFDNRGENYAAEHPDVLNYQGSDIQKWCSEFLETHFSEAEKNALHKTYKSDDAYQKPIVFGGKNTSVDFDAAEKILNGDQLFLLSAEEANNPAYGFTDDASRTATLNEKEAMWWLRSPHTPTYPLDVGMVFTTGSIMDFPVNAQTEFSVKFLTCARPACNLDTSKILEAKEIGTTEDGHIIWTLTLAENNASSQSPSIFIILGCAFVGVIVIALILIRRKSK